MTVILGFTGTQRGMTRHQARSFRVFIQTIMPDEFHHGDCIGADKDAHEIVKLVAPDCVMVGHPPSDPTRRAFCKFDKVMSEKPYLTRNRAIVKASNVMCATPGEDKEVLRSGTWSTIRNARAAKKRLTIIFPS